MLMRRLISGTPIALALVFLTSGIAKLAGSTFSIESFARWGFSDPTRVVVGGLEVAGAAGLIFGRSSRWAAAGLSILMIGATMTHLRAPAEGHLAWIPAVLAAGLALLAIRPRPELDTPRRVLVSRCIISAIALLTVTTPFLMDWSVTHLFNPRWPPHARFHGAHTMVLGAMLGLAALTLAWRERSRLHEAIGIAAVFWVSQACSAVFPGVAFIDPEFAHLVPSAGGLTLNQLWIDAVFLGALAIAWRLAGSEQPGEHREEALVAISPSQS